MASNQQETLKNGLKILSRSIKKRQESLKGRLSRGETLSPEDENWLDNEGNLIEEQRVVERLTSTSNYQQELEKLNDTEKGIVERLRILAGDLPAVAGNKRKRMLNFILGYCLSNTY